MQTNLSDIKQLLTDWYLLTLENPLYAGALVLSAWLLTVFFYSIRLFFLKRKQRIAEQAYIKLQEHLDEAMQDNKQSEEKLITINADLAKEQQLNSEFALKVADRNQVIVENIKQLASQFNLSEQLLASDEKPKAEYVWQQQDNIQVQLVERFQAAKQEKITLQETYDQEKDQFSKQNAQTAQLQKTLDLQISKSAQLERDLNAQKLLQQKLRNESEQILADKLAALQAKFDLETSLGTDLHKQKEIVDVESGVQIKASTEAAIDKLSQVVVEPVVSSVEDVFVPNIEELDVAVSNRDFEIPQPSAIEEELEQVDIEPDYTKSNLDITSKFKSLFGKNREHGAMPEESVEISEISAPDTTVAEIEKKVDNAKSSLDISGKFKNLLTREKKQAKKSDIDKLSPDIEELEDKKTENSIVRKFKSPFGKDKQKVDPVIPVYQTEDLVTEEESEEQVYEPDYGKSNFKVPGKFKKLFGKS